MKKIYKLHNFENEIDLVFKLKKLIIKKYADIFFAVIAHGSVGNNDVIPYSDFDGLLIVKDQYLKSKRLEKFKEESMKLILEFDPLQHHGWFQISELQLSDYPQNYLPHEVLEGSKIIFPKVKELKLTINYNEQEINYKRGLKQLIENIERQYSNQGSLKNERVYNIKSFLSKIMLLPSMYYAAKNNDGIFKGNSFEVVRNNFSTEEWECIDISSNIRANWNFKMNFLQKLFMTRHEVLFRRLTKKYISPKTDKIIIDALNDDFFKSLKLFINKINKDIFAA